MRLLVTPGYAEWLVANANPSRRLRPEVVHAQVAEMRDGTWDPDGHKVLVDGEGRLVAGQHQLRAVIEAGVPVLMEVRRDAVHDAQRLHDRRRAADPGHDRVGCWCCCLDCGFDVEEVTGDGEHGGAAAEGV
jgi:hypothetical protein